MNDLKSDLFPSLACLGGKMAQREEEEEPETGWEGSTRDSFPYFRWERTSHRFLCSPQPTHQNADRIFHS